MCKKRVRVPAVGYPSTEAIGGGDIWGFALPDFSGGKAPLPIAKGEGKKVGKKGEKRGEKEKKGEKETELG